MQEYIKMNGIVVPQPDEGLGYDFETTYTQDTTRAMSGTLYAGAMYTVESLAYKVTYIPAAEASRVLQIVDSGKPFTLHYFSLHYGKWRDGKFYVGKASIGAATEHSHLRAS